MVRDEVTPALRLGGVSYEPLGGSGGASADGRKGAAGHDRNKAGGHNKNSGGNNIFAGILGFFADLGKNKDRSSSESRADTSSTPLTARDSDPGEDCCELHDSEPAPLEPRWNVYPPAAAAAVGGGGEGQQKRRTSQPVAIRGTYGARAHQRPSEPVALPLGRTGAETGSSSSMAGEEEKEEEKPTCGDDDADAKIKAWQRRRVATKRGSFTVSTAAAADKLKKQPLPKGTPASAKKGKARARARAWSCFFVFSNFEMRRQVLQRCRRRVGCSGSVEWSVRQGWASVFSIRVGLAGVEQRARKLNFGGEFPDSWTAVTWFNLRMVAMGYLIPIVVAEIRRFDSLPAAAGPGLPSPHTSPPTSVLPSLTRTQRNDKNPSRHYLRTF